MDETRRPLVLGAAPRFLVFRRLFLRALGGLGRAALLSAGGVQGRAGQGLAPAPRQGRVAADASRGVALAFGDGVGAAVAGLVLAVFSAPRLRLLLVALLPVVSGVFDFLVDALVTDQAVLQSEGPFAGLTLVRSLAWKRITTQNQL